MSSIKNNVTFGPHTGRVEVTHYDEPCCSFVTFSAQEGQKVTYTASDGQNGTYNVDPALVHSNPKADALTQSFSQVTLLDNDNDDVPGKLSLYMKSMAPIFYERETSAFMRLTLIVAAELSATKQVSDI